VTDGVNDDLVARDLVEDQEGIGRRCQAADDGVIGTAADLGMHGEQVDDRLMPL